MRQYTLYAHYSLTQYLINKKEKVLTVNPFNTNFTKWSNTLKQFVSNLPTNCLSVFDHFVRLMLKGLNIAFPLISTRPQINATF